MVQQGFGSVFWGRGECLNGVLFSVEDRSLWSLELSKIRNGAQLGDFLHVFPLFRSPDLFSTASLLLCALHSPGPLTSGHVYPTGDLARAWRAGVGGEGKVR